MMTKQLLGKNAIVTGANRGLGLALIETLAREGCNIWAFVRQENSKFNDLITKLSLENNVSIESVYVNLASEDSIKEAYKVVNAQKKPIDILINNAGIGHMGLFQMTKMDFIYNLYDVNVFAPMILSQLAGAK